MTRAHKNLLLAAVLAAFFIAAIAAVAGLVRPAAEPGPPPAAASVSTTPVSGLATVGVAELPTEAAATLALIDKGGPYPYGKDGSVFGNREGILPPRERGYYREYTVPTPGSPDRGARRLVVGRDGDVYYTADHYESFRQVLR